MYSHLQPCRTTGKKSPMGHQSSLWIVPPMGAVWILRSILTAARDCLARDDQSQLSLCYSGQIQAEFMYISIPLLEALGVDTTGETGGKRRELTPTTRIRPVSQQVFGYSARARDAGGTERGPSFRSIYSDGQVTAVSRLSLPCESAFEPKYFVLLPRNSES